MATIKLGQRPKVFKPVVVTFEMPDGSEGSVQITYNYRTRIEFGELIDGMFSDAGQAKPEGEQFSMRDLMEKTRDKNADYLLKCIAEWNLAEDLTRDNLCQLANELPAGASAVMDRYRSIVMDGRLGN